MAWIHRTVVIYVYTWLQKGLFSLLRSIVWVQGWTEASCSDVAATGAVPGGARPGASHRPQWGFINGTGRELKHEDKHMQLITPWLSCTFHTMTQSVWSCVFVRAVFSEERVGATLQAQLLRDAATVNVKSRLSGHLMDENSVIKSTEQNRITLQVRAMSWPRWHLTVEIQQTFPLFHLWVTAPTHCPSHAAARTHLPLLHVKKVTTGGKATDAKPGRSHGRHPVRIQAVETRRQSSQAVVDRC